MVRLLWLLGMALAASGSKLGWLLVLLLAASIVVWRYGLSVRAVLVVLGYGLVLLAAWWRIDGVPIGSAARPWQLPPAAIKKNKQAVFEIVSIPQLHPHSASFVVAAQYYAQHPVTTRWLISWYGHHPLLRVGDVWQVVVRLRPPHGLTNPGKPPWQRWFAREQVTATGYVVANQPVQLLRHSHQHRLLQWRQHMALRIQQAIHQPGLAAIIIALVLGLRQPLTAVQWAVFQKTGTSHLIAVSGLHIGLLAALVYRLVFWLSGRWVRVVLWWPAPYWGAWASVAAAVGYALIAGWALPAQRACIMWCCVMWGQHSRYRLAMWQRLSWALIIIITVSPWASTSASFWLSFVAVAWIAYALLGCSASLSKCRAWLRLQFALFAGLLPLSLLFFLRFL